MDLVDITLTMEKYAVASSSSVPSDQLTRRKLQFLVLRTSDKHNSTSLIVDCLDLVAQRLSIILHFILLYLFYTATSRAHSDLYYIQQAGQDPDLRFQCQGLVSLVRRWRSTALCVALETWFEEKQLVFLLMYTSRVYVGNKSLLLTISTPQRMYNQRT